MNEKFQPRPIPLQESPRLVKPARAIEDPARWYIDRKQLLKGDGEILNPAFVYTDYCLQMLRSFTRVRVLKSHKGKRDRETLSPSGVHMPIRYQGLEALGDATTDEKDQPILPAQVNEPIIHKENMT